MKRSRQIHMLNRTGDHGADRSWSGPDHFEADHSMVTYKNPYLGRWTASWSRTIFFWKSPKSLFLSYNAETIIFDNRSIFPRKRHQFLSSQKNFGFFLWNAKLHEVLEVRWSASWSLTLDLFLPQETFLSGMKNLILFLYFYLWRKCDFSRITKYR